MDFCQQSNWSEVAQSCPTLCDPIDCSLSGSSIHAIFQARVLEWIAISFSRGSSRPRNRTRVSRIAGRRFTIWATREAHVSKVKSLLFNMLSRIVRKLIPVFKSLNLWYFVIAAQLKLFTTDWVLNPCAGTQPQPKPCLELKLTWLRLKPMVPGFKT